MKLQNLTIIFIIIILPIVLVLSAYIGYEIKTINKQNVYNNGLITATHDAIFAFELNTKNDIYSNNAEKKRSNIKASIKTFENSLSTACNLGLYNNQEIEEYIPAIVFGLYDGFYMYSPTQTQDQGFKHELRNYVYYSEEIKEGNIDIIIRYTLDNYVAVSGTINGDYVTRAGYLINLNDLNGTSIDKDLDKTTIKYKGLTITGEKTSEYVSNGSQNINQNDEAGKIYYKNAYEFTKWFMDKGIGNTREYLNINNNDPEDENSAFVQHKREIMKDKIEGVLNSSITAYANKTRNNYKMPKFSGEDWDKIYNNISVISFVQGMNLGFKNYNNYCILNSTNNGEYVNPNLMYFTDGNSYHDIRCGKIKNKSTTGYKIGDFEKIKYDVKNEQEEVIDTNYYYKHNELACYECVNGNLTENNNVSIYDYVRKTEDTAVKKAYFTALGRERQTTTKLLNSYNAEYTKKYTITYASGEVLDAENMPDSQTANIGEAIPISENIPIDNSGKKTFSHWETPDGGKYYPSNGEEKSSFTGYENTTLTAVWNTNTYTVTFNSNGGTSVPSQKDIEHGGRATIPANPTRSEYTFLGWYTDNITFINEFDFNTQITKDITLYAKWERNNSKYIVYYKLYDKEEKVEVGEYNAGTHKLKDFGQLSWILNYLGSSKYIGWYDEYGNKIDSDTDIELDRDITFYAYQAIHLKINCSNGVTTSKKYRKGEEVNLDFVDDKIKENQYFFGWYDSEGNKLDTTIKMDKDREINSGYLTVNNSETSASIRLNYSCENIGKIVLTRTGFTVTANFPTDFDENYHYKYKYILPGKNNVYVKIYDKDGNIIQEMTVK